MFFQRLFIYSIFILYAVNNVYSVLNNRDLIYAQRKYRMAPKAENDQLATIESDTIIEGTRGKRISMKCIVNNAKNYKITWLFKGIILTYNNIRIRNDKRISIENPQPNVWVLVIDLIDSKDEGYYSCRLDNGLKKFMHLIIGVPPKFIGSHHGNHVIVNTIPGENVTLACAAEGNPLPTIYWYRNSKLIATGAHLRLRNISRFAQSEYECVARNKIEPAASRRFKINVNFKPIMNVMYNLMYHLNHGELQVVCEISGNPIHTIKWLKDGELLKDDTQNKVIMLNDHMKNSKEIQKDKEKKRISIHNTHFTKNKYVSKLRVMNVNYKSNGVYECVVNGFLGNATKHIVVTEINENSAKIHGQKFATPRMKSYKELTFESSHLGREARSNNTKSLIDDIYTKNLISSASSLSQFFNIFSLINLINILFISFLNTFTIKI